MSKYIFSLAFLLLTQFSYSQQTVGLFINDSLAYDGYTLFAPGSTNSTYLIDNCGEVVHSWHNSETNPGAAVYLLENGNLVRTGRIPTNFNGGGSGGRIEIYNWSDSLIWRYDYSNSQYHHHHDVAVLPNGNILVLAWEYRTIDEFINKGGNPNIAPGNSIWSERIVEIKPIGSDEIEVVWIWKLWDHLVQNFDDTKPNYGVISEHPELWNINYGINPNSNNFDWIHFNAVNYNADLDQIALSSRHFDEIYIIDHSTTTAEAATHSGGNSNKGGDILYRWGNPEAYDRGTSANQKFHGQHDVKWIPAGYPDEGKLMVFNNGITRVPSYSSVDVIDPPIDANNNYIIDDSLAFGPTELFWTYEANPPQSLFSSNISGAHRLPNGNTLLCEGRKGNFYEVDLDGNIRWHYKMPVNNNGPVTQGTVLSNANIFRATKYLIDYQAFEGKDLTPTGPIELNPLPSNCELFTAPVNNSNISKLEGISIRNNPFTDFIFIKNQTGESVFVEVFDVMGKRITQSNSINDEIEVTATNWAKGIYVVRVFNKEKNQFFIEKLVKQ